ncbi:hypothetical protein R1A27_32095 (plasmid) [Methylobacterium sp. NMS12]|uniref:hypothetical protein n=1 Tax=Methylobacterium sp. NMS12 TaxID=3079766 RepID=UPI003F8841DF
MFGSQAEKGGRLVRATAPVTWLAPPPRGAAERRRSPEAGLPSAPTFSVTFPGETGIHSGRPKTRRGVEPPRKTLIIHPDRHASTARLAEVEQVGTSGLMSITAPSRNLADTPEAWRRTTTWAGLAAACSVLAALDRTVPDVGIGQAFIPLLALAGWRLGAYEAYAVAMAAACLNIFPHHADEAELATVAAAGRDILRLGTLAFIALAVGALRHSYDRERTAARRDALTGVLNRAAFGEYARAMLANRPPSRP